MTALESPPPIPASTPHDQATTIGRRWLLAAALGAIAVMLTLLLLDRAQQDEAHRTTNSLLHIKRATDDLFLDRKSTRLNSSHIPLSRMPSSA